MRTFVISLERALERRARMQATLDRAGIAFEFFPAVDGRADPDAFASFYDPRAARMRLGRELGPGELGCFASHRALWKIAVDHADSLLVLEDDVDLAPSARTAIAEAQAHLPALRLLRLSGRRIAGHVVEHLSDGYEIVRFPRRLVGTCSYMIHPSGAAALLASTESWAEPVDEHIDRFWAHGLEIFGAVPFPIWQRPENYADSSTDGDRDKLRGIAKLWREVVRMGDEFGRNTANIIALPRLLPRPRYRPR